MKTFATCLVVLLATPSAMAHHGLTAFDQTRKVTLTGKVTAFHFVSPHAVVEFEVEEQGQMREWHAQLAAARALKGWTAASLAPGDTVTVTGYAAKNGSLYVWVTDLSASNGMQLRPPKAPDGPPGPL
ncbi:MAG: DUF6152 family protein [Vicinamibacterales bacterium]